MKTARAFQRTAGYDPRGPGADLRVSRVLCSICNRPITTQEIRHYGETNNCLGSAPDCHEDCAEAQA